MSDQDRYQADDQPYAPRRHNGLGGPPPQGYPQQMPVQYKVFDPELVHLPEPLRSDLQNLVDERVEGIVQHTIAPYRESLFKQVTSESDRSEQKILTKVKEWAKKAKDAPPQISDTVSASSYPTYIAPVVKKEKNMKSRNQSPKKSDHTTVDHLVGLQKYQAPVYGSIPQVKAPIEIQQPVEIQRDYIDDVYVHLDPISVSLQERVRHGGHYTSILINKPVAEEEIFEIVEVGIPVRVSKTAVLSAEIERQENRHLFRKEAGYKPEGRDVQRYSNT